MSQNDQIVKSFQELDKLDLERNATTGRDAPVGLAPTTAAQVSGATVFDTIESLSSTGQVVSWRALANGAICAAIYIAFDSIDRTRRTGETLQDVADRQVQAKERLSQQMALYNYSREQLDRLAQSEFDKPMALVDAFEFISSNSRPQQNDDLPEEVLKALGITREQLAVADAAERQRQLQRDAQQRETLRGHKDDILSEVAGFIDDLACYDTLADTFNANQHNALFGKVLKKLKAEVPRLLGLRSRYQGALADAMLLSADLKLVDKAFVDFTRANAGELREAA